LIAYQVVKVNLEEYSLVLKINKNTWRYRELSMFKVSNRVNLSNLSKDKKHLLKYILGRSL